MKKTTFVLLCIGLAASMYAWVKAPTTASSTFRTAPHTEGKSVQHTDNTQVASNAIQIALILDTSNSMDGLIDQAKSQLWKIVNELTKAQKDSSFAPISIALYEYGNSTNSMRNGYIRQITPFTNDLDALSEQLFSLTTSGGDEYCGQVIQTSLNELEWSQSDSALKVVYIAGNEPFNQGHFDYSHACVNAKEKNVLVNTIFCGDYNEGIQTLWKHGADLTGGTYMNINSDVQVVMRSSPYDIQIDQLNTQLNNTYIYYGTEGKSKKSNQVRQDKNQKNISLSNNVTRTLSKSSYAYDNSLWDLVDAYKKDKNVVTTVSRKTLPDSIQTFSDVELEKLIIDKTNERSVINQRIVELGAQREQYFVENQDTTSEDNTLGQQMVKSIRIQAKSKGFQFKKN